MSVDTQAIARQERTAGGALTQADREQAAGALAHILATGDLAKLTNEQRVAHYLNQCDSLGLNPISRPFDWLMLDNKLVLYPNKSCAEQLRRQHQISVKVTRREIVGDLFVCEVEGRAPNGRTDESSKYVPLTYWDNKAGQQRRLQGALLANAFAKAETGAKRRLVLSMIGLSSPPDPEDVKSARFVVVDGRGNVISNPTQEQRYLAEVPAAAKAIGEPTFETVGNAGAAPLAGHAGQAVTHDELHVREQPRPRATFKASDEEVEHWRAGWFAAVKDLSLDTDEQRHQFVAGWTAAEWPEAKRTNSLTTMLRRCTRQEADDFLGHVRAICDDERRSMLEDVDQALADEAPERGRTTDKVRDSARLTGARIDDDEPVVAF